MMTNVQPPVKMPKERKTSQCPPAFDMAALKESLAMAEQKAAASSSLRKLSRKTSSEQTPYVPPKQLLMYLVRMGSFTSIPKAKAEADPKDDLEFPPGGPAQLLARCRAHLAGLPPAWTRRLRPTATAADRSATNFRVLQWNQLSQTLGTQNDGFCACPPAALEWPVRRWRLLEELVRHRPGLICLQEVDHFPLLERALASLGYAGHFVPKPDSPCIYLPANSGPDGCAVFYRTDDWQLVGKPHSRVLEVWHVQSNQVAVAVNLRSRRPGATATVCLATTHLKARPGALLATLRHEQGKDLLQWLEGVRQGRPLLLTGDFNAEPEEPVVRAVGEQLASAYPEATPFTTWKIRESGEQKGTLDYIFHSPALRVAATLDMPSEDQVGPARLPSLAFPSDHLSLVADFCLI